jgi:preprotein translocase subunit SecD
MKSKNFTILIAIIMAAKIYAADPAVDKAIDAAQKKYPSGDYPPAPGDRAFIHSSPAPSPSLLEIHAVATSPDATKKLYSLTREGNAPEMIALEPEILLDAMSVKAAWVEHDSEGNPFVRLELTKAGADKFGEATEKYLNKRIGFVFAGRLISAPVIRSQITGGSAILEGHQSEEEAAQTAAKLDRSAHE